MQNCSVTIGRRSFCCSIVGLAVGVVVAKLPFEIEQSSKISTAEQEFAIVNGWVLTREDLAASELTTDVV
jgi:hypothetical protein